MTYTKLNPEFKAKWIAALRSGEYIQGEKYLYKAGRYCCIGVACAVAGIPEEEICGVGLIEDNAFLVRHPELSPLSSCDIKTNADAAMPLTDMNDIQGKSFNEIADWIEENL